MTSKNEAKHANDTHLEHQAAAADYRAAASVSHQEMSPRVGHAS